VDLTIINIFGNAKNVVEKVAFLMTIYMESNYVNDLCNK
jgi:hypothetical protein